MNLVGAFGGKFKIPISFQKRREKQKENEGKTLKQMTVITLHFD